MNSQKLLLWLIVLTICFEAITLGFYIYYYTNIPKAVSTSSFNDYSSPSSPHPLGLPLYTPK